MCADTDFIVALVSICAMDSITSHPKAFEVCRDYLNRHWGGLIVLLASTPSRLPHSSNYFSQKNLLFANR